MGNEIKTNIYFDSFNAIRKVDSSFPKYEDVWKSVSRDEYIKKLLHALCNTPEKLWFSLPMDTQNWYNDQVNLLQDDIILDTCEGLPYEGSTTNTPMPVIRKYTRKTNPETSKESEPAIVIPLAIVPSEPAIVIPLAIVPSEPAIAIPLAIVETPPVIKPFVEEYLLPTIVPKKKKSGIRADEITLQEKTEIRKFILFSKCTKNELSRFVKDKGFRPNPLALHRWFIEGVEYRQLLDRK